MRFFAIILVMFMSTINLVDAYEPTLTHPGLTEQVIEFYNLQSGNKIDDAQRNLIIQGSMDEDDPPTRALNHFYDPVRNIGIDGGRTAKEWALVDFVANKYSWDDVLRFYAEENEEEAFIGLGHILHLVEDMGVPDHTRNDQHLPLPDGLGGNSPYEEWGMKEKSRRTMKGFAQELANEGVLTRRFTQIGEHFDFLANYSNKNFFSRDTVFSGTYASPNIQDLEGNYVYIFDNLTNKKEIILFTHKTSNGEREFSLFGDNDDTSILSSYFDRLSRQIIPSGAGVIELFFKEGEKARVAYQAELRKKQDAEAQANAILAKTLSQKGLVGLVGSGFVYLLQDNVLRPIGNYVVKPIAKTVAYSVNWTIQEAPIAGDVVKFASISSATAVKDVAVTAGQFVAGKAVQGVTIIQKTVNNVFSTPQTQEPNVVVAQESATSAQGTAQINPMVVNVVVGGGGEAQAKPAPPKLVFVGVLNTDSGGSPTQIQTTTPQVLDVQETASGTEEVATEEVMADSAGAAKAAPTLSAPQCLQTLATDGCLLATTTVHFEWPEVSGASYYGINKNGEYATTTANALEIIARDFSDYKFEIASVDVNGNMSATSSQTISIASIPLAINEVAWMGTIASANDEWFEIKNNTAHTIDLTQWELNAKDGTPHLKLSGVIAPRAYLIFERTDDTAIAGVSAHQIYTGAFSNSGEQLALSHASTTFDQTPEGAWVAGENSTTTRRTMERYHSYESGADQTNWSSNLGFLKNGVDAEGNSIDGTPGAQNSVSTLFNQDITSDTVLSAMEERYVVTNEGVWVHASTTLTIEPGVTVSFLRGGDFYVNGAIDARGTAEKPIVANSLSGRQEGDFWISGGTSTSTFENVRFENIEDIGVMRSNVDVRNSEFISTDGGVDVYEGSVVHIENTRFASTTDAAVNVFGGTATVASSTVSMASGQYIYTAIGVYRGALSVSSSTIREAQIVPDPENPDSGAMNGISIFDGTAVVENTTISSFAEGVGILISEPSAPVVVLGGEITGNAVGISAGAGEVVLEEVSMHDNVEELIISDMSVF